MTARIADVRCVCGEMLGESVNCPVERRLPCRRCGSQSRLYEVSFAVEAKVYDHLTMVQKRPGVKGFLFKAKSGWDLWRDTGRWVKRHLWVDRERYVIGERIVDPQTGTVLKEYEEPLEQHQGHGSAKRKPQSPAASRNDAKDERT